MKTDIQQPIEDQHEREQALNTNESFIIQAPAGSGKTELLTRRFLALLSRVNNPEEILAMTFTKKSAAEMRARIIKALAESTSDYAAKALTHNNQKGWNLLENPNRLRIQTIDSFNSWLTRQLPILSHFGSSPEIEPNPHYLYQEAIQQFLLQLEENYEWSDAIEQLLFHLDNDITKLESFLISMLAKRDQWLPLIALNNSDPLIKDKLESHLNNLCESTLKKASDLFPNHLQSELLVILKFAIENLQKENKVSDILNCLELNDLTQATSIDLPAWKGIKELLFKRDKAKLLWRESVDIRQGFPPKLKSSQDMKARFYDLIENLQKYNEQNNNKLIEAFKDITLLPNIRYKENQWQILQALHLALQIAVAQLRLVFQEHGKIDYVENAQAALSALGDQDNPTDLALTLDYRIQHILVDEFQDTSSSQYQLLEKLTFGWQNNDGRTLFLVGDPMQSIYRFREADVSLFLQARNHGINLLKLKPLTLKVNFRSAPAIIEWVNSSFSKIFPAKEEIVDAAISYSKSSFLQRPDHSENARVQIHPGLNQSKEEQANAVVQLIQSLYDQNQHCSTAILVRARSHLDLIIPQLQAANINYQAIEIDRLVNRTSIQDLVTLTKALLNLADRVSWLGILRAPWCGLPLSDLYFIGNNSALSIMERLENEEVLSKLSIDGSKRLSRIYPILKNAINNKYRNSMRQWIENTWMLLGGPACLENENHISDANTFFDLIEQLDKGNSYFRIDLLEKSLQQLFASSDADLGAKVQIMTMHSAKGLEFDNVILPFLESKSNSDKQQILTWMKHSTPEKSDQLMMAPLNAIGNDEDEIYNFIKHKHNIKADHENSRLLYVACTRAKNQLHLLFNLTQDEELISYKPPSPKSLLSKLLLGIDKTLLENLTASKISENSNFVYTQKIKRLTSDWTNLYLDQTLDANIHQKISGILLPDSSPKIAGVLIHKIFELFGNKGKHWWTSLSHHQQMQFIDTRLKQLRMNNLKIKEYRDHVFQAVSNFLEDTQGQWILLPHLQAENEYKLTCYENGKNNHYIIDRTFVDENNYRWIIDYKTSSHANENIDEYLQTEKQNHQNQLNQYARALQIMDNRPIYLGLYFPLFKGWINWEFKYDNVNNVLA